MRDEKFYVIRQEILNYFLFIFVGLIFVCIGIFVCEQDLSYKDIYTEEVRAICIDFDTSYTSKGDIKKNTTYTPIFSYTYNGLEYISHSNIYSSSLARKFKVNNEYILLINPDNPSEFFHEDISSEAKILGIIFIIVGGFSAVFALIVLFSNISKQLKN